MENCIFSSTTSHEDFARDSIDDALRLGLKVFAFGAASILFLGIGGLLTGFPAALWALVIQFTGSTIMHGVTACAIFCGSILFLGGTIRAGFLSRPNSGVVQAMLGLGLGLFLCGFFVCMSWCVQEGLDSTSPGFYAQVLAAASCFAFAFILFSIGGLNWLKLSGGEALAATARFQLFCALVFAVAGLVLAATRGPAPEGFGIPAFRIPHLPLVPLI